MFIQICGRGRGRLLSMRPLGCTRPFAVKNGLLTLNDNRFLIGARDLEQRLGDSRLRVVDCRFELLDPAAGRKCYERAHIPGAVFADLDHDLAGPVGPGTGRHPLPEPGVMCATFGRLGIDSGTTVVVYDERSGGLAARAWWLLRWLGHENAMLLDGGLAAWQELGLATDAGDVSVPAKRFSGTPRHEMVLGTEEIAKQGVQRAPYALVDARSSARFRGEEEPIDPVAGHIPAALNLPYDDCLDEKGRWRPVSSVADRLQDVLGPDKDRPWAAMCGSGVTACHLVVAALVAGYAEPRVYVGSWSEWIRDPGRKVQSGAAEAAERA